MATTDLNRHMLAGFYRKHLPLLYRYPYCQACGQSLTARCARAQAAVEGFLAGEKTETAAVRRLFPLLFCGEQSQGSPSPFLGEEAAMYSFCLEARLMSGYLLESAAFSGASFQEARQLLDNIAAEQEVQARLTLARTAISTLRTGKTPPFALCRRYCRNICRYGYEGSILCRDATLHNTLLDLIEALPGAGREEQGANRQRLSAAVRNWFHGECDCVEELSLCFTLSKLNELAVRESLQMTLLESLAFSTS